MQGEDYHAAVIQKHWRGYQVRKSLRQLQLDPYAQQMPAQQQYQPAEAAQIAPSHPQPQQQLRQDDICSTYIPKQPDIWSEATSTLIRNRGSLQAALGGRRQTAAQQQEHKLQEWKQFTERQARRYVPAPPNPQRRVLAQPACYRLRIHRVSDLPQLTHTNGVTFQLQLGVSLYDEALGTFYGSTCYSPADSPQQQQQLQAVAGGAGDAVGVDFCFDVFFHSVISDPRCIAVVEVIMLERDAAGLSTGGYSVGWAQLPLFAQQQGQMLGSQAAAAPLMSGTPRYLAFRSVCGDDLPPPTVVQGCHITYQAEVFPSMRSVQHLLPQDFLVCYTDLLPGLRRFDTQGQLTSQAKGIISSLASPMLTPVCAVGLDRLQLQVPQVLHNLLSVLPQLLGVMPPPDLPTLLAVPSQAAAVSYSLRIAPHNGRVFVGPQVNLGQLQVQPSLGSLILRPEGPDKQQRVVVDGLPADRLVVLVLELLAAAVGPGGQQLTPSPAVLVGRVALAPFAQIAADGNTAALAVGQYKLSFSNSNSCPLTMFGGSTEGMLPVNWRALLRDTAVQAIPDPAIQFGLVTAACSSTAAPAAAAAMQQASQPVAEVLREQRHAAVVQQQQQQPEVAHAAFARRGAAGSVVLAAKHLEEAASIPVKEVSSASMSLTQSSGRPSKDGVAGTAADAHRQQLQQLAETMQQQIGMLARAVEELKEERQTLRSSLTLLESAVAAHDSPSYATQNAAAAAAANWQQQPGSPSSRPDSPLPPYSSSNNSTIPASELERLKALKPNGGVVGAADLAGFSGAQAAAAAAAQHGSSHARGDGAPSRAVMQQLHEAGMSQALPGEVQALLRRSAAATAAARSPNKATKHHQQPFGITGSGSGTSSMSPLVMDIEARDPRTASDVVLQLLAFRPSASPEAACRLPPGLRSLYFTLQLYHFGPVLTEPCLLAAGAGEVGQTEVAGGGGPGQQQQQQASADTFVLVPAKQVQRSGAGLVLKYQVDGSAAGQLLPGQDPGQAAFEGHMAFCSYLAKHKLAVDVWDGDSLLQLGSCAINLQGLLQQGREFSELLLEVPLLQASSQVPAEQAAAAGLLVHAPASAAANAGGDGGATGREPLQLGQLVVRLINIGREPSNAAARVPDFNAAEMAAAGNAGKKVRVRAAPLQPGSPVAKELRGGQQGSRSPFSVDWHSQAQQQADGSDDVAAASAADIISFEQRKAARAQQLHQLLNSPGSLRPSSAPGYMASPSPPRRALVGAFGGSSTAHSSPGGASSPLRRQQAVGSTAGSGPNEQDDPFIAMQRQLLADVDAVRKRQKPGFIRSQLRKDLVTQCTIQPAPGQVLLLEHVFANSLGRDAVFDVRVSHPQELQAIESMQDYRQLQLAVGRGTCTSAAAAVDSRAAQAAANQQGGGGPPSLMQLASKQACSGDTCGQLVSRGRIFLASNERVSIPFRFRLQQQQPASSSSSGKGVAGRGKEVISDGLQQEPKAVTVEFVPAELDYPINILELQVRPKPLIIDRTLRYHCPERDIMRVAVPLAGPWSSSPLSSNPQLAAAAARGQLAAAASRPDVTVSVVSTDSGQTLMATGAAGAAGLAGTSGAPCEVHMRYKCGACPEVVQFHVWLYGDGCMAQPLEVWQVFVHSLQKVDMRAAVGQSSSTSLALTGGTSDRQVAAYSSHPDELTASPQMMVMPAGGICALNLVFKPRTTGRDLVRVHLVDPSAQQLAHAFIVATEASPPQISRRFEVELQAGMIVQKQVVYASPYSQMARILSLSSNKPWLLSFQPATLELPPRASKPINMAFDGRAVRAGDVVQALLFVNDEEGRAEECMEVVVNVV